MHVFKLIPLWSDLRPTCPRPVGRSRRLPPDERQHPLGHDLGRITNAIVPSVATIFGKRFGIGEQLRHMTPDPIHVEFTIGDHQSPMRIHHRLRVEALLAIANRQRHIDGGQTQPSIPKRCPHRNGR